MGVGKKVEDKKLPRPTHPPPCAIRAGSPADAVETPGKGIFVISMSAFRRNHFTLHAWLS